MGAAATKAVGNVYYEARKKAAMYNNGDIHRDDLFQEGMIAFITAVNTYDPKKNASFRTYAAACINNRIISVLRSRNAQKNIPQDMMQNIDDGEEVQDFSADPQNIYSAQEDDARFEDLLSEKLTDFERRVLTLRAEKLSYEEIAERLGTNPKAVDNALQRIRRKLASDSRR
jgi:RNA polymerase sporulation-specific sigma factor